jgi:predicted signal transduction protein with EAL and GGDEF domain
MADIMDQNHRNYGCNYEIYSTIISVLSCIFILVYIRTSAIGVLVIFIFLPK